MAMRPSAPVALIVLALLAGCLAPEAPAAPTVPEELGTQDTTVGTAVALAVPRPVDGARYLWSFGDGDSSLGATTSHAWTRPGVYSVAWQEMKGEEVLRSSVGFMRVHQPIRLADTANSQSPSEEHFEVFPNATGLTVRFTAPSGIGHATAILVDPSGAPAATETLDLAGPVDVTLTAKDPMPGSWFVYVETPDGAVTWTVEGTVSYG